MKDGYVQRDFSGGQCNNVNPSLLPSNTVDLALNVDLDEEIGSAVSRLGRATVGSQIVDGSAILGLHQHIDSSNTSNNRLFAYLNDISGTTASLRNVATGLATGTNDTGLTSGIKMRFLTFLGSTLALNGRNFPRSYHPSTGWVTSGSGPFDLSNFPSDTITIDTTTYRVNLCIAYLDRVYTAGATANNTRLYYSGVSNGTSISWTVGNGYIDIENNNNSGGITALAKVPGYLLVFKERSLHRFNGSSAFPESLVQLGTPSQEAVVMGAGLCAFYSHSNENAKGFYITDGGRPVPISHDNARPIKKWIDAIGTTNEANMAGWATERHFCWSVGDLTVDGETYSNVVLRYNRLLNQWTVRTYPSDFRCFASYLASGVNTIVGGDDDGTVYQIDKPGTYTDAVTSSTQFIPWKIRQQHMTFGTNVLKQLSDKVVVLGKNIDSIILSAIVDENLDDRIPIGSRSFFRRLLSLFGLGAVIKGTTLSVEVSGQSTGARSYIREIEMPVIAADKTYV